MSNLLFFRFFINDCPKNAFLFQTGGQTGTESRRESMKRAQSVEVLSILSAAEKPVFTESFLEPCARVRPPSVSPPPLPPRYVLNVDFSVATQYYFAATLSV